MFGKLWRKFRASHEEYERLQDENAKTRYLLGREDTEREKRRPVDLPPGPLNNGLGMPPG